ncbi:MAG: hypothetical protein KJ060_22790 [Candidatus Hydrogenedentes bacterium]|nr:hypothetical protein [Candidatus Hydrogenedentota bacterium]
MGRAKGHKHFRGFAKPEQDRDRLRGGPHSSIHDVLRAQNRVTPRLTRPGGTTTTRTNRNRNTG